MTFEELKRLCYEIAKGNSPQINLNKKESNFMLSLVIVYSDFIKGNKTEEECRELIRGLKKEWEEENEI